MAARPASTAGGERGDARQRAGAAARAAAPVTAGGRLDRMPSTICRLLPREAHAECRARPGRRRPPDACDARRDLEVWRAHARVREAVLRLGAETQNSPNRGLSEPNRASARPNWVGAASLAPSIAWHGCGCRRKFRQRPLPGGSLIHPSPMQWTPRSASGAPAPRRPPRARSVRVLNNIYGPAPDHHVRAARRPPWRAH
jgi:hypothetical protein